MVSFELAAQLLEDVLPTATHVRTTSVRNHLQRVAKPYRKTPVFRHLYMPILPPAQNAPPVLRIERLDVVAERGLQRDKLFPRFGEGVGVALSRDITFKDLLKHRKVQAKDTHQFAIPITRPTDRLRKRLPT